MNYAANIKNGRMIVVRDGIDAAAGAAYLEIGTTGMASVLASIPLANPASSVTADVLSLLGTPMSTTGIAAGTADEARIRDGDANDVVTEFTVGVFGSGKDIIVDSITIAIGQTVRLTSGSITHG